MTAKEHLLFLRMEKAEIGGVLASRATTMAVLPLATVSDAMAATRVADWLSDGM
jgi:hypothetical protein